MGFKVSDASRFKKGLDASDQKKWTEVANKALAKLLKKKVPLLEAEQTAVKQANSMFGDKSKSMSFKDMQKTDISIMLASVEGSDEMQLILPTGTTHDAWYGELIFTENFMKEMVKNSKVLKNTEPFLNRDHDRGQACAWAEKVEASEDGLLVKWDFTSLGKGLVEDKIYKYFSAEIGSAVDIDTGERVYPVFRGCALTNAPVMKNLPKVHLHENTFKDETLGGKEVNFKEIMEALAGIELSETEIEELAKVANVETSEEDKNLSDKVVAQQEVITSLNEKVKELTTELATFSAEKIEVKLSEALKAGKITPALKEKWEVRLSEDFEGYSEILDEMVATVDLSEHGSEQDAETAKKLNASDYTGGTN